MKFRSGLINEEINKSVGNSKTIGVINKIDKNGKLKFPENVCELRSEIENIKSFIFISCKELRNIQNLISLIKKQVANVFESFKTCNKIVG